MGIYEEMMKQYQDSHKVSGANKSNKEYDLKNYFNTMLPKGVKTIKKKIRILPPEEGKKTSIDVMYGHVKKVDGQWKTLPCLKHEKDEECPFCQAREALLAGGSEEEKELAKEYSARKFYIIKLIDRDNEADGVKFWRIKHNYKKEGSFDKIMSAIEDCGHDVTDVETGRDLIVTIKEGTNGNAITIGYALESTPLTTDETKLAEWTSDVRTWENVYSVKNYEYLAIIVKGYIPMWDKELNKWVPKTETVSDGIEDEVDMGEELPKLTQEPTNVTTETKTKTTATKTTTKTVAVVEDEDEDDDLPF